MVLLTTTPYILQAISSLPNNDRVSFKTLPSSTGQPIDHKTVLALSRLAKGFQLNTLLRGASVYVPAPPPKPKPSAEYVALMERLRREQELRDYRSLVTKKADESWEPDTKDDVSPSLVFNILVSVLTCAGAVFYLTRWWPNDGIRVLLSLLTAVVVGVAEVVVYASYLRKVKTSRDKERSLREKKEFLGEFTESETDESSGATQDAVLVEGTQIWGKGVNGGARRRIREKWDKQQDEHVMEHQSSHS